MSRILDDKRTIELNGIKYQARFDMLAIAECQYYLKARGQTAMTVPKIFNAIQEGDYFIICNLLIFCIKSCNPSKKMIDLWGEMKFANRGEIEGALVELINASMPKSENNENEDSLPTEQEENEG